MNPVEIAALDALDLLVVVDNESDTLSSVDKGVPQLPELGRLVARVPHLAPKDGHDCVEPWGHLCLAYHGFSALVTGRHGSEERSVLFDVEPKMDSSVNLSEEELVLSTLEPDQLAEAKKQRVPRRHLKGSELLVLWFLRIYLLFMIVVVIYQAWTGAH
jgi:hypothetical protein